MLIYDCFFIAVDRSRPPTAHRHHRSQIIDSSIWVAITTGLPARRDARLVLQLRNEASAAVAVTVVAWLA